MMTGFYGVLASGNLLKKLIGLTIFQASVFLFYISIGKVKGGTAPIVWQKAIVYDNPLPHVLILTAIVVSVSTLAVAASIVIRIYKEFGTIEQKELKRP